jgi:spermidine dehydrogenase
MLDFPVSMGGYKHAENPDEPIVVHMERVPSAPNKGLTPREQHRAGRYELLSTSFEHIERATREHLGGMLSEGGFDPARDIAAITVNRWPHGYSYWYNGLYETQYEEDDDERYPHVIGRKRFGRIAIANSDAGAWAMLEGAIYHGHRAIEELKS